ncbi:hypothetical protein PV08_06384 [Exophiala spinifera]|uniref:Fe2OG dioxygenase domain-containing protein n=1 Tax=Exophiala spinifera TaxID=91928 RepID=A0A0D2BBE7_9EURO|nr:uncharacterized protein PV08_06384 [Exophiala spinifera]KIW16333.1 hypothetical protein PV08_06384 [Exophiala spinifera]
MGVEPSSSSCVSTQLEWDTRTVSKARTSISCCSVSSVVANGMDVTMPPVGDLLPSCYYIPSFINRAEEDRIIKDIRKVPDSRWTVLTHRRLLSLPSTLTGPARDTLLDAPLPSYLASVVARLKESRYFTDSTHQQPNHVLINEYKPGEGIMPHEDGPAYAPITATVSLGSHTVLEIYKKNDVGEREAQPSWRILQEPCSLLVTTGHMYAQTLHGISEITVDENLNSDHIVNWDLVEEKGAYQSGKAGRGTRISLTFRDVTKVAKLGGAMKFMSKRSLLQKGRSSCWVLAAGQIRRCRRLRRARKVNDGRGAMTEYHKPFTAAELQSLDIVARVTACLSLAGSSFTIISFLSYAPLRKPVNRLAFSIAISNVFGCLAYSWGRHPVAAGRHSAWCQTQGLFITWFVMTDPLLVMVLAFNVFLTVRTSRNANRLKTIDFYGICFAFVAPAIPAFVFLCWRPDGKTVYGDATLWCWIAREKDILRLVEFYIPVWVMIFTSICLFALSGKQILQVRKKLKIASCKFDSREAVCSPEARERRFSISARAFISRTFSTDSRIPPSLSTNSFKPEVEHVTIERVVPVHSREELDPNDVLPNMIMTTTTTTMASTLPILDPSSSEKGRSRAKTASRFDKIHWKYAKFAFLCTVVLFITWIPISINRVYNNFINPDHQIFGLYFASALCMPLHGFGNFVIYTTTSWTECRDFITCSGHRSSTRNSRRSSHA